MRILFITLLLLPLTIFSQKTLQGKYCHSDDYLGFCIKFENDSNFTYYTWSCITNYKGKGKYEIHAKQLILVFDSTDNFIPNKHISKTVVCDNNDSISINFKIHDTNDSLSLPYCNLNVSYEQDGPIVYKFNTNELGTAKYKFIKQNKQLWITSSFVGFNQYSFKVNTLNCQTIDIYMNPMDFGKIENEIYIYRLKKIRRNKIYIKQDNSDDVLVLKKDKRGRFQNKKYSK